MKDDARVCESPKPGKQDRSLDVVSGNESKRVHTEVPHALDALLLTRLCKPLPKDAPSSKPVLRLGTNALKFVRQCLEDLMPVLRKGDAPEQRTKAAQIIMEGIVREPVLSEFQAEVWHMICGYVNNVVKGRFAIVVHQAIVVPMWKRITSGDVSCPELPLASFMRPVNNQTIIRKRSVDALIVKHFPILRSTRGGELLGYDYFTRNRALTVPGSPAPSTRPRACLPRLFSPTTCRASRACTSRARASWPCIALPSRRRTRWMRGLACSCLVG